MSAADKAIRWSTVAAVVVVAGVAASFSYQHALDVIGHYSRASRLNIVFPLTVDGLIYCGSMVLLNDARRGLDAHKLAYWMLGIGIAATLTVNAVSGLAYGIVGAVIAGWPAVALVLSYEGLMLIVRRSQLPLPASAKTGQVRVPEPPAELNGHAERAREVFAADIAAGKTPGIRKIRGALNVGQDRAQQVRGYLADLAAASPN